MEEFQEGSYVDEKGYLRDKYGKLVHRQVAYHQLYLKNKLKYSLPFRDYDVHHINTNKLDNRPTNLQIVTREEHTKIHGIKTTQPPEKITPHPTVKIIPGSPEKITPYSTSKIKRTLSVVNRLFRIIYRKVKPIVLRIILLSGYLSFINWVFWLIMFTIGDLISWIITGDKIDKDTLIYLSGAIHLPLWIYFANMLF